MDETEKAAVVANQDEISLEKLNAARYALVRRLSPARFAEIWNLALSGELTFDQAVDEAAAWWG